MFLAGVAQPALRRGPARTPRPRPGDGRPGPASRSGATYGGEHGERAPCEGEAESPCCIRARRTVPRLYADHQHRASHHERDQRPGPPGSPRTRPNAPGAPQAGRAATTGEPARRTGWPFCSGRPRSSSERGCAASPDREEEREHGRDQVCLASQPAALRSRGTDHHVGQVPTPCTGGVQQRPPSPRHRPRPRPRSKPAGPPAPCHWLARVPHMTRPPPEAHHPGPDVRFRPALLPTPRTVQATGGTCGCSARRCVRAEEAAPPRKPLPAAQQQPARLAAPSGCVRPPGRMPQRPGRHAELQGWPWSRPA